MMLFSSLFPTSPSRPSSRGCGRQSVWEPCPSGTAWRGCPPRCPPPARCRPSGAPRWRWFPGWPAALRRHKRRTWEDESAAEIKEIHINKHGARLTLSCTRTTKWTQGWGRGSQEPRGTKAGGDRGGGVSHMQVALFQQSLPRAEPKDRNDIWPLWSRNDPNV